MNKKYALLVLGAILVTGLILGLVFGLKKDETDETDEKDINSTTLTGVASTTSTGVSSTTSTIVSSTKSTGVSSTTSTGVGSTTSTGVGSTTSTGVGSTTSTGVGSTTSTGVGSTTASDVFSIEPVINEYPPSALTSNSTIISGQTYGNGSYTASASSVQSDLQPWLIFDKKNNTPWASQNVYVSGGSDYAGNVTTMYNGSLTYLGEWVQIQLPTSVIMKSFILTAINYADPVSPRDFAIFGSNNGSTWTSIFSVTGEPFNIGQSKTFIVSNTTAYKHYRLAVNKRNRIHDPYSYIHIAEWRIFGYLPNQTN